MMFVYLGALLLSLGGLALLDRRFRLAFWSDPRRAGLTVGIGVVGFLLMFGGLALGVLNYKSATGAVEVVSGPGAPNRTAGRPGRPGGGKVRRQPLKDRLEERFRRRYDQ